MVSFRAALAIDYTGLPLISHKGLEFVLMKRLPAVRKQK